MYKSYNDFYDPSVISRISSKMGSVKRSDGFTVNDTDTCISSS